MIQFQFCKTTSDDLKRYEDELSHEFYSKRGMKDLDIADDFLNVMALIGFFVSAFLTFRISRFIEKSLFSPIIIAFCFLLISAIVIFLLQLLFITIICPDYYALQRLDENISALEQLEKNIAIIDCLRENTNLTVHEVIKNKKGIDIKTKSEDGYTRILHYKADEEDMEQLCQPNLIDFSYMDEKIEDIMNNTEN